MQLNWNIDRARGRLSFGKLLPMTGNRYRLCVSGREEGKTYQFLVMGENVAVALARSEHDTSEDTYSIAFNTTELRKAFRQEWHEIRVFHVVANDGENTIAEGDLAIGWCPVWTDPESGEVYTMQGEPGLPGEPGQPGARGLSVYEVWLANGHTGTVEDFLHSLKGPAASERYAYCEATGKYHRTYLSQNARGEYVWAVDDTPLSGQDLADASDVVFVFGVQTIAGKKIFSGGLEGNLTGDVTGSLNATGQGKSALVPTVEDNDNSQKAASTAWMRTRISNWWTGIKDTAVTWTKKHVFSAGLEGDLKGSIDATGQGKSALVPTVEDNDNSQKAASTAWVRTRISTWWTALIDTAVTWTKKHVFSAGLEGNLKGDVTGDLTGDVTGGIDATGTGKSALVPTAEDTDNSFKSVNTKLLWKIIKASYRYASIVLADRSTGVTFDGLIPSAKYHIEVTMEDYGIANSITLYCNGDEIATCAKRTNNQWNLIYNQPIWVVDTYADENGEMTLTYTYNSEDGQYFRALQLKLILADLPVVAAEEEENEAEGGEE